MSEGTDGPPTMTTRWVRGDTPLMNFLRTESGSALVLLAGTVAALVWANVAPGTYDSFWATPLSVQLGGHGVDLTVREWLNSGLMTFFFLVVGVEARREFDLGELRERRRVALPLLAGLGGMLLPIAVYLLINSGRHSAHGWGIAMSTDTAFALGLLVLVGRNLPERVRTFLLTVMVVDDVASLAVIAVFYSASVQVLPLVIGLLVVVVAYVCSRQGLRRGVAYAALGVVAWVALEMSGVDPVVVGLIFGLLTLAYTPATDDLERATGLVRLFREQPTPELARSASSGLASALSPNDLMQARFHPWSSYLIVPLFALANAGIAVDGGFLARAYTSPITLGVIAGYVLGKPLGILAVAALVNAVSRGRLRPPVGWAAIAGSGSLAGIGFTVALLIATLAFSGADLAEAKLGVLSAAVLSSGVAWVVFRTTGMLSPQRRARAILGTAETIIDLAVPVDDEHDHIRGPEHAKVTVVEYGDFECPYCGQAEPVVRELLAGRGDVRYVFRHLPLPDVHPRAQLAAEAAEAAAEQGKFWEMHDLLMDHQDDLRVQDLLRYADDLGLDVERYTHKLKLHIGARKVAEDVDSAQLSGVSGTPTFFVNGLRHYGAYDIAALTTAIHDAKARVAVAAGR